LEICGNFVGFWILDFCGNFLEKVPSHFFADFCGNFVGFFCGKWLKITEKRFPANPLFYIFKYVSTNEEGKHFIYPDKFEALLNDEDFKDETIRTKIEGHQFPNTLKPLIVLKKGRGANYTIMNYETKPPKNPTAYYTHAQKEAIYKHRQKYREKYNDYALKTYHKQMEDNDWRKLKNEKAKKHNRAYREKMSPIKKEEAQLRKKQKQEHKDNIKHKQEAGQIPRDNKAITPRGRPLSSTESKVKKTASQIKEDFEKYKARHYEKIRHMKLHKDNVKYLNDYFDERLKLALL